MASSSSRLGQRGGPRLSVVSVRRMGLPAAGKALKPYLALGGSGESLGTLNVVRSSGVTDLYFSSLINGFEGILEKLEGGGALSQPEIP